MLRFGFLRRDGTLHSLLSVACLLAALMGCSAEPTGVANEGRSERLQEAVADRAAPTAANGVAKDNASERQETSAMLIEPTELAAQLPRYTPLDVRDAEAYAAGHIPGARRVDVRAWQQLHAAPGGLQDADAWSEKVGKLGISHDSDVVVYGGSLSNTARIWWTLKYLGLKNVAILDGGWEAWREAEDRPVSTTPPEVAAVAFEPKFQSDRLMEIDELKQSLGSDDLIVVDARSDDEFTGRDVRGERGGHIPGSAHLEWKELIDERGRFKSRDELRALFRERGILPEQEAVTC